MAEGLIAAMLEDREIPGVSVRSAGIAAWEGSPAAPEAVSAMAEHGIDVARHSARRIRDPMVEGADLILGMTGEQADVVMHEWPDTVDRTFTLKELVRLLREDHPLRPEASPDVRLREAVAWAASWRDPDGERSFLEDVSDPLGLSLESFRATVWELGTLCELLVDGLFGVRPVEERQDHQVAEADDNEQTPTTGAAASPGEDSARSPAS